MPHLRFAIVGCGRFAGYHAARLAAHRDAAIVACVDVDAAVVAAFIAQHLAPTAVKPAIETDLDTMLRTHRPDAVVIATPHTMHFAHAMAALAAGCHVFIEKPMVTCAADAQALEAAARRARRIVVVGYNTPCTPELNYLRHVIRNPNGPTGLGRLEVVSAHLSQNWLRWTIGSWRQNPALSGGGMAYDTGAHLLCSLCWTVESPIKSVFALVDTLDSPVDINAAITVRFQNGVFAALAIAGNCPSESSRMTYCFAGGRIEVDGWYGSWIEVHNAYGRVKYPTIETTLRGQSPLENFIDALLGRDEPRTSPSLGVIQSQLMDAIYESARSGRMVDAASM
jgi:predicted dehydrogenase